MTAQAMSAGTAETRSGSGRQPASAFANGDAPNSLSQKDSRMTDTTEQQAAFQTAFYLLDTLAGEGLSQTCPDGRTIEADETVQALCSAFYMEPADDWHSELALRLASVSSASAEIPAGMKPWTGGDGAPDDWDGGSVLRADGQTEHSDDITIQQWKQPAPRCKWNIVAYTPARVLKLPEPVPATNQAGEVIQADREFAARWIVIAPENAAKIRAGKWDRHEGVKAAMRHRIATQPATSQEGTARDAVAWLRAKATGFREAAKRQERRPGPRANAYDDAAAAIEEALCAATPTPPTLSEDLRAAIEQALQCTPFIRDSGLGHMEIDYDCGDPWEILRAALARAQVKAS